MQLLTFGVVREGALTVQLYALLQEIHVGRWGDLLGSNVLFVSHYCFKFV